MDALIDCELLGEPVAFHDEERLAFYSGLMCNNTEIFVGDCIRVEIDEEDSQSGHHVSGAADAATTGSAYGQVLAIFAPRDVVSSTDLTQGEMVEIRWFHTAAELENQFLGKRKRQYVKMSSYIFSLPIWS